MIYALVHYPKIDVQRINQFRKKYDPQVDLIEPHITLMFPISESIGEGNLVNHLEHVLSHWQSFPIHLQGLEKSWDDYLFLLIQEGNDEIIRLHSEIYTEILTDCRKEDIQFIPHLTLGVFVKNESKYSEALAETQQLDLNYRCIVDKLHLVKVNDDKSQIVWSNEFSLRT